MSHRKWKVRIRHMIEAIDRVSLYTRGMDLEAFSRRSETVDAAIRNLQVIGEAARLVPEHIQQKHPEIPWVSMRGMRNVLVHDYDRVNVPVLWNTIQWNLPPLVPLLNNVLEQEPEE